MTTTYTGSRVRAVPRSGCCAMSTKGTATTAPPTIQSRAGRGPPRGSAYTAPRGPGPGRDGRTREGWALTGPRSSPASSAADSPRRTAACTPTAAPGPRARRASGRRGSGSRSREGRPRRPARPPMAANWRPSSEPPRAAVGIVGGAVDQREPDPREQGQCGHRAASPARDRGGAPASAALGQFPPASTVSAMSGATGGGSGAGGGAGSGAGHRRGRRGGQRSSVALREEGLQPHERATWAPPGIRGPNARRTPRPRSRDCRQERRR